MTAPALVIICTLAVAADLRWHRIPNAFALGALGALLAMRAVGLLSLSVPGALLLGGYIMVAGFPGGDVKLAGLLGLVAGTDRALVIALVAFGATLLYWTRYQQGTPWSLFLAFGTAVSLCGR